MSSVAFGNARQIRRAPKPVFLASCAIFLVFMIVRLAIQYKVDGGFYLEDDAYYYTIIANNLSETGRSTFDGQTLTNGYHPLWLLLLALQAKVLGGSFLVTMSLELILAAAGLWFTIASFRSTSVLFRIVFTLLFCLVVWPMVAKGMEVSLLVLAIGLFLATAVRTFEGERNNVWLGLAAVFCIGARIDAAVFVLPILLLVVRSWRDAVVALVPVGLVGALYAGVNLWLFGLPFPVSGAVKSLGGLQINEALIHQITAYWGAKGGLRAIFSFLDSYFGRTAVSFLLPCAALPFLARGTKSRLLALGFCAGFVLYAVKLFFFSSWEVWPWYGFPAILGLGVMFHVADDMIDNLDERLVRIGGGVAVVLGCAAILVQLRIAQTREYMSFEPINVAAVSKFEPFFEGGRVAMGDRAGSFAVHYPGPVTQLEGIVNDKAYFEALEHHADIRPLLCARGVRYVLSFEKDLGDYATAMIHALRHHLTHYPSPALTFARSDEIGHISDLTHYDNTSLDEGDNYLYAWRLSGCETAASGADGAASRQTGTTR